LLTENRIGDPLLLERQSLSVGPLRMLSVDREYYRPDRTPRLVEIFDPGEIFFYRSGWFETGQSYVGCILFVAEFQFIYEGTLSNGDAQAVTLSYGTVEQSRVPARLAFLLVEEFDSRPHFFNAKNLFIRQPNLNITLLGTDAESLSWQLQRSTFGQSRFLQGDQNPVQTLMVSFGSGDATTVRTLLPGADAMTNDTIVLCGTDDCSYYYDLANGDLPSETAPREDTTVSEQRPTERGVPSFEVSLEFVAPNGEGIENATNELEYFGGLACVLYALAPGAFVEPFDDSMCDARRLNNLAERNAAIRVTNRQTWQIMLGAGRGRRLADVIAPSALLIDLPPGQPTIGCFLEVFFTTGDGEERVVAASPVGTQQYLANFQPDAQPRIDADGNVTFRLVPNSSAECGGPETTVVVASEDSPIVRLVDEGRERRAIVHLAVPMANRRASEIGLGQVTQENFGLSILDAIASAHGQVSTRLGERPWLLQSMALARMSGIDGVSEIIALNAAELRTNPMETLRGNIAVNGAVQFGLGNTVFDPATLRSTVSDVIGRVGDDFDAVTVTLIAPVLESSATISASPCRDNPITDLANTGILENGLSTQIVAFPIIGLSVGDALDGSSLAPISGQTAGQLGGIYRCTTTPDNIEIFPFFVEPWRAVTDITPRYATALSDQLAQVLEGIVQ
jgi:hypothetical protein